MKIAVIGPTHPYKGGIAQHTTELARRLSAAGHDVVLHSWKAQYPQRLYPGKMTVTDAERDVAEFDRVERRLAWYSPWSWVSTGRRLRDADLVLVAHSNPFQIPHHWTILRSMGRRPRGQARVMVAHNVVPHDASPMQQRAVRLLAGSVDHVVVHSADEARRAADLLPNVPHTQLPLPPFGPAVTAAAAHRERDDDGTVRLLALGFVRPYKGLGVLLAAMRDVPGVHLTIRGECWDDTLAAAIRAAASEPAMHGRVDFRPGYVDEREFADLFATHDMAALPYLEATGSQNTALSFAYGRPVIVSDLPALVSDVCDGENGIVVPAGDVDAWRAALRRLDVTTVHLLAADVHRPDADDAWQHYVNALGTVVDARTAALDQATERRAHVVSDRDSRLRKSRHIVTVLQSVRPLDGASVLDDGCGSGYTAEVLGGVVGPTGDVVGIDPTDQRVTHDAHRFVSASGTELPFDDAHFDVVVSNHVIEHVGDLAQQRRYVQEARRVLRDDGVLYLAVPNKFRLVEAHYSLPLLSWLPQRWADRYVRLTRKGTWYDVTPLRTPQLHRVLREAGFTVDDRTLATVRDRVGHLPVIGSLAQRVPDWCYRPLLVVVPTIIVVARPARPA